MSGLLNVEKQYLAGRRRPKPAQTTQPMDTTQSVPIHTMRVHTKLVSAVAFFKDGQRIVTASEDKTVRIWDVDKRVLAGGPFKEHSDAMTSIAVSPDDRRIASGGGDGAIIIWDVDSTQMVFGPPVKHTNWMSSVCFSPDGKRHASGSDDCTVIIWDVEATAVLSTLKGLDVVKYGLKLASGSCRKTNIIQVWSTNNDKLLLDINAHRDWIRNIVWTPDGRQLISASDDKKIKFWDSSNRKQIGQPCTDHTFYVSSLAISSDGFFIASASFDRTVRLWNKNSHEKMGQALKHTTCVSSVAISLNGELLVSGDYDGNVHLWSIKNTISAEFRMDASYFAHRGKAKLGQNLYADAGGPLGCGQALRGVQRYDDAFEAFTIMLSKLDDAPDLQIRQLLQQYVSPEVEDTIRQAIHAQLENAPLRLINTSTGRLCDRDAQINAFMKSAEHGKLLHSLVMHAPLQTELTGEVVAKYFSWVMLSHRWESKEPRLHDVQGRNIYDLDQAGTIVKLQKFCKVARDAGYRWAWSDTCCIDPNNNVELGRSVNSMFIWYHLSALTIVYLSDEFLAPKIVLFYQADWSLYLDKHSRNHKESVAITQELERSTGINARALASTRVTTLQEDIAYSLFGIFGVHLPNALGRLLQEIIAHSGDIMALDWVGQSSSFNSCLPADISSYKAPSYMPPSLSEDEMQISISTLRNTTAEGLRDLQIATEEKLAQFSPEKRTMQTFLLIRPWNRYELGLINFADETQRVEDWPEPGSPSDDKLGGHLGHNDPATRELRLIVRLRQPFVALC
ncbi:WD40-repeat-containing domain protein [Suillus spraguei]|nr:WD40-repeat-containing domain protein [Suillus spraguei]